MRPDQCGFGRPLEQLPPGDREIIEQFQAWLAGEVALAADGITYVPVDSPAAVHFANRPETAE